MLNYLSFGGRIKILGPNIRGAIWMVLAVIILTGMFAVAKHLMQTLPMLEVAMFRFLMSLFFFLPWLIRNGFSVLKSDRPFGHFWRSFFGATSLLAGMYAIHHLLLADATVLTFTIPLWSIILAALFLGERVRLKRSLATFIGFAGVILVVKPQSGIEPATLVALLAAILASCAITTMKDLTRTEPSNRIVFYFLLYGTIILGIPTLYIFQIPTMNEWLWLGLLGFFGSTGQYCLTQAYAAGDMTIIAPLDFTRVIVAGIIGYLIFDEIPDAWACTGAIIVISACAFIVHREAVLKQST